MSELAKSPGPLGGSIVASNDGWNIPGEEVTAYGLDPKNAKEAALVATLSPGNYSALVSGVGSSSGVGLFELYDLTPDAGRVANISTRGRVETGDEVMIGGFILSSQVPNKVIVRAIGPSLPLAGKVADPTLELRDQNGGLLEANDNWIDSANKQAIIDILPPSNDKESAIVRTLSPAAYTAIVRGANNTTGIAVVEVYALN